MLTPSRTFLHAACVCALAACAMHAWAGQTGDELLANGGFENPSPEDGSAPGALPGWAVNGAAGLGGSFTWIDDANRAHSGRRCLLLQSAAADGVEMAMMSRHIVVRAGSYTVKAAVQGTGRFVIYLYQYDQAGGFLNSAPFGGDAPGEWTAFEWTYVPPAGVAAVAYAVHAQGRVLFDDCSLRPVAGGPAAQTTAPPPDDVHFLTIPRIGPPPRIDGDAGDDAWSAATATTGFVKTGDLAASTIQPLVQVGYDAEALYVAFVSPIPAGRALVASVRGVGGPVWEDDDVEVLLQPDPPHGAVFHVLGGAGGGYAVHRNGDTFACDLSYGSGITASRWVAELAIPWRALGLDAPADNAVWGVNFCRGHANPRQWTAWSPSLIFADPRTFGRMRFGDGPIVRVLSLGELSRANVELQGTISAGNDVFILTAWAGAREVLDPGAVDATNVHGAAQPATSTVIDVSDGSAPFHYRASLEPRPARLSWSLARKRDGLLLQQHGLDFDPAPPLIMSLHPSPAGGTIAVRLDATGMHEPGARLDGQVAFRDTTSDRPGVSGTAEFKEEHGSAVFDLTRIATGDYEVTASVASDRGPRAEVSAVFKRAGEVPSEYSRVGFEPEVPAPWTPVTVAGRQVGVWNRSITFAGSGLPSSVQSAGVSALARPVTLRAFSADDELRATEGHADVARLSDAAAQATGTIRWPGLSITTTSRMEFDGCVRVDLDLRAGDAGGPDRLVLEIPFTSAFARLVHSHVLAYEPTTSGSIPAGTGAVWHHAFAPVIWIGNTHAGLCWFAESQEGWVTSSSDPPSQEIVRREGEVALRVHLARRAFPPGSRRRIVFGLHVTPVKPLPAGWRRTRMGAANPFLPEDPYFDTHVGDPAGRWWGWPEPKRDAEYEREMQDIRAGRWKRESYSWENIKDALDKVHAVGGRLIWYDALQLLSVHNPWYHTYGKDWALTGHAPIRPYDPWWMAVPVCPAVDQWQDLYVGTVAHAMQEYDYDGVYLDLFYPWRCANPIHGCGYVDDEGERQAAYTIWAMREQLKRLYRVVHARPGGLITGHYSGTFIPAVHGFVDSEINGEQYWSRFHMRGAIDYHDTLPLDKCRTEVLGRQWGWIPLWLPQFKTVAAATTRQMLSLILLHDSLVWPAYVDAHECHQANAILSRLGFQDATFIGYFDTPPPAATDREDVLVSAYARPHGAPGSAILVVTNHGLKEGAFDIAPDAGRLQLGPGDWTAAEHLDVKTSRSLVVARGRFSVEVPGKDFRIVFVQGRGN